MTSYEKVYNQYNKYIPFQEEWQAKYSASMETEYLKMFPKSKKFNYKKLPEGWLDTFHNEWKPIAQKIWTAYENRKKLLKKVLNDLRDTEINIEFQNEMHMIYSCSSYNYSTQTCAESYAHGDVKAEMFFLSKNGVTCEIRKEENTYQLWANVLPWQFDYLKWHNSPSVMDYCVVLWKMGINPKVKWPFLDDKTFEKSMAIHMGRA